MTISSPSKSEKKVFTDEEKDRLVLLGTTAGSPGVVFEAIESGSILDPAHKERAKGTKAEWEHGASLLAPYFEKQAKYDAMLEELREMGRGMERKPVQMMSGTSFRVLER